MSICVKIKKKSRKICTGDLRDRITLQNRSIQPEEIDFTEDFTNDIEVWAMIETARGLDSFDGVTLANIVTHKIYIRFLAGVTEETWILFDERRFDIMDVENLDERKTFMLLRCKERGQKDIPVNTL